MPKRAKLPGAKEFFNKSSKELKHKDRETEKQINTKTTLYFSPEGLKALETAKFKLLTEFDVKTTKSKIVETAVKEVLKNIEKFAEILE